MPGQRKLSDHEPQEGPQHDRATRIAAGTREAVQAFGDLEKAARWLRKPNGALGGAKPIELLATAHGTALVRQILGIIEYGGIA
ncbi:MAG: hypothetical protein QOF71_1357 [Candidatus Eremiobacteraeota bacterium]|jgi:putative toxin-antitoxin system antitoxin component (TIGR02293 family)|nr:hypothetical protein [Candidatus Eremiobacteraeota bacterium]